MIGQVRVNRDGWTGWMYPDHDSHMVKCCDCGLVHQMKFDVFMDDGRVSVRFKARRYEGRRAKR